jgi:hypothetical protein
MARPRYKINPVDWLDCLDWLDHQLKQPHWITELEHPIHSFGIATLNECIAQWREVDKPTDELCQSVQEILEPSFTIEDWGRLRKSLSARKRRRKEKRLENKQINITLTPSAHHMLVEYRNMSSAATFSEAIELSMGEAMNALRVQFEQHLQAEIIESLVDKKPSEVIKLVETYLALAQERRSLANSCKIAHQLFLKRPERETLRLTRDRFAEDLVWNEVHLKITYKSLSLW